MPKIARASSPSLYGAARRWRWAALMLFAYTDQAPPWMRNLAFQIDGAFGYPFLALIRAMAG